MGRAENSVTFFSPCTTPLHTCLAFFSPCTTPLHMVWHMSSQFWPLSPPLNLSQYFHAQSMLTLSICSSVPHCLAFLVPFIDFLSSVLTHGKFYPSHFHVVTVMLSIDKLEGRIMILGPPTTNYCLRAKRSC